MSKSSMRVVNKKRIPFVTKVKTLKNRLKTETFTKVNFKRFSSVGRFCSTFLKKILKRPPQNYVIVDPSEMTISYNNLKTKLQGYLHRFEDVGSRQHGPFYIRSSKGILRRILKTMCQHKGKHREYMKRVFIFNTVDEWNKLDKKADETLDIQTRCNTFTKKITLVDLLRKIYPKRKIT